MTWPDCRRELHEAQAAKLEYEAGLQRTGEMMRELTLLRDQLIRCVMPPCIWTLLTCIDVLSG